MAYDAMRQDYGHQTRVEDLNPNAMRFYNVLENYNQPIWHGSERHFTLSIAARYFSIKCDYNTPQAGVDDFLDILRHELAPRMDNVPKNYYKAKKLLSSLGLSLERIYCYLKGCILHYKNDSDLTTINSMVGRDMCNDAETWIVEVRFGGRIGDNIPFVIVPQARFQKLIPTHFHYQDNVKKQSHLRRILLEIRRPRHSGRVAVHHLDGSLCH
ncbi:hypothetical protein CRG98_040852 [Punica granatum]|uniref:Uncharacterized protein n=1 Tax=Punica granatum TaxID=22663 RepID=A0A2I0I412_PUNGR|nr:hypothetical protein CRG98_040852 [Punica granatum]